MAAHLEPAYEGCVHRPLPITERLTARTLILPLFHELTEAEQDSIVTVIAAAASHAARVGAPT
jgi:perosamine synthetase